MDSTGKTVTAAADNISSTPPTPPIPIYGVVTLPKFVAQHQHLHGEPQHHAPRRRHLALHLVVGGKSYLRPGQRPRHGRPHHVHLQPAHRRHLHRHLRGVDAPAGSEAPSPITLTPFTITAGWQLSRHGRCLQQPRRSERHRPRRHRPHSTPTTPSTAPSRSPRAQPPPPSPCRPASPSPPTAATATSSASPTASTPSTAAPCSRTLRPLRARPRPTRS